MQWRQMPSAAPSVTLVEDHEFDFRMIAAGDRQEGKPCRLTLAINGADRLSFLEQAGARAPGSILLDLSLPSTPGRALALALATRPWQHRDGDLPLIAYPDGADAEEARQGAAIAYLVCNRPVDELIKLIRDTLDLPSGSMSQRSH